MDYVATQACKIVAFIQDVDEKQAKEWFESLDIPGCALHPFEDVQPPRMHAYIEIDEGVAHFSADRTLRVCQKTIELRHQQAIPLLAALYSYLGAARMRAADGDTYETRQLLEEAAKLEKALFHDSSSVDQAMISLGIDQKEDPTKT